MRKAMSNPPRCSIFTFCTLIALCFADAAAEVRVSRTAEAIQIENDGLKLALSPDGRSLLSFCHGGQEFVGVPSPLYEILIVDKDGVTVPIASSESAASEVTHQHHEGLLTLTVTAAGHGKHPIDVTLDIRIDDTGFTRWRARINNRGNLAIRSVTYPLIAVPRALGGDPVRLVGANLVDNPGFEEGETSWTRIGPDERENGGKVDVDLDTRTAHSGKACARLSFDFEENAQVFCPLQSVKVLPDTDYLLSAYVKTELESGTIHVELQDVRGWKQLCKASARIGGKSNWRRLAVLFRTAAETNAIRIGLRHVGSAGDGRPMKGHVWFDDVSLVKDIDRRELVKDDCLILPRGDGVLFPAPGERFNATGRNSTTRYLGASMQFMAYYDQRAGLYLAAHDSAGNVKELDLAGGSEAMTLAVRHLVPERASGRVDIDYDTLLGGFPGDWYTAADVYREWAQKQWWCRAKWMDRPDVAHWAKTWPSMVKLDGYKSDSPAESYQSLANITADFRGHLGQDVITFFHGWGKNGWQMGAPRREPHPPWGGIDVFRKAMSDIRDAGGRPFVFIMTDYALEAREVDPPYNDRETFQKEALPFGKMGLDGTNLLRQFRDKHFLARMCPTTEYWRQCLVNKTVQLVELGVPFVQMDCFPCTLAQPCYNPSHGHDPGFGKWWFEGYRDILDACREAGKSLNPEFAMTTEEMCELFIPNLDFYMNRAHGSPRSLYDAYGAVSIPLFTYIYHEYLPPYAGEGDGTTLPRVDRKDSSLNYRGIALSLLWGRLFSVRVRGPYESYEPEPKTFDFYLRAHAAARGYAYEYVVEGRMIPPLPVKTPEFEISYWRYWANPPSSGRFISPAVLSSAWQSPKGSRAALFVNITDQETPVEVVLPRENLSATVIRNGTGEQKTFGGKQTTLRLQPFEIMMIEYH